MIDWLRRHASDGQRGRRAGAGPPYARRGRGLPADGGGGERRVPAVPRLGAVPVRRLGSPRRPAPAVERTHPELLRAGRAVPSPVFADPRTVIRDFSAVVEPPQTAPSIGFSGGDDLAGVRRFLRAELSRAGLGVSPPSCCWPGRPRWSPTRWCTAGRRAASGYTRRARRWSATCGTAGRGFADPLAAYLAPDRHATRGHGLWLGRQACDRFEVATDGTGTHVRLLTSLPAPREPAARPLG